MSHNYPLSLSGIFFFCSLILRVFFVFFPDRFNNQETALLNSGTKAHRMDTHKGKDPHHRKAGTGDRPRDVRFPWLKDLYTCGDNHLDGCLCEETLGALF